MKKLLIAVSAAGLVVSATGCAATTIASSGSPPSKEPAVTGVVISRSYLRMVSPAPYCRQKPLPVECRSRWTLVVRGKDRKRHSLDVSKGTYRRYHLGDHYPAGGRP